MLIKCIFLANIMLNNIKPVYLHRVFHGIRFKVNNEDWLSVTDSLFFVYMCVNPLFRRNHVAVFFRVS